ncbi:hypothetical protein PF005_g10583 [Phytophthora fragariae]|uniref:Uncharacterized protein n=1 Tax=Phytophthora fragariae TaxID=53985 RepID=A0A6A3Y5G8_9STRA|nr:hypothetical protein PF007_g10827 [Phytophthora fragariae]KAE9212448.1 hypothetical protein PF005_g10583 [Phytophthora fragariae]KAE9233672.1 hypothetical protein PF002_g12010 [Phytophthora fragariae]KAE9255652.1 hypothetical protein PF004_g457 [Phytophthora fragariae]KAE9310994.1 hypothetical protein PF001_g9928 [Phytophthora fragariae]
MPMAKVVQLGKRSTQYQPRLSRSLALPHQLHGARDLQFCPEPRKVRGCCSRPLHIKSPAFKLVIRDKRIHD